MQLILTLISVAHWTTRKRKVNISASNDKSNCSTSLGVRAKPFDEGTISWIPKYN